jgi:hypothetical protein
MFIGTLWCSVVQLAAAAALQDDRNAMEYFGDGEMDYFGV